MYDTLILADKVLKLLEETETGYTQKVGALHVALAALPSTPIVGRSAVGKSN